MPILANQFSGPGRYIRRCTLWHELIMKITPGNYFLWFLRGFAPSKSPGKKASFKGLRMKFANSQIFCTSNNFVSGGFSGPRMHIQAPTQITARKTNWNTTNKLDEATGRQQTLGHEEATMKSQIFETVNLCKFTCVVSGRFCLASHYSAIGDTISCDAPFSAIGVRWCAKEG